MALYRSQDVQPKQKVSLAAAMAALDSGTVPEKADKPAKADKTGRTKNVVATSPAGKPHQTTTFFVADRNDAEMSFPEMLEASKLSTADFAALSGASKRAVEEWSRGARDPNEIAMRLARLLRRLPAVKAELEEMGAAK